MKSPLTALGSKFRGKDDDQLRAEIESLRNSRRAFTREHEAGLKELRHEAIDKALRNARDLIDAQLLPYATKGQLAGETILELGPAWLAIQNPDLARELHRAVDRADDLSPLTLAAFEKKLANFEVEIRGRETEIDRRAAAARLEEAKRGMADVAAKAEA